MTDKQKEAIKIVLDSVNSGFLGCDNALTIIEGIVDKESNIQYIPYPESPSPYTPIFYETTTKTNNGEME